MASLARFVYPNLPYLVTHRGNRRQPILVASNDWPVHRELLADDANRAGLSVCGYCPMINHEHRLADWFSAFPRHLAGPGEWGRWLALPPDAVAGLAIRRASRTRRPCGSKDWVAALEVRSKRRLGLLPVGRLRPLARGDDCPNELFEVA